MRTVEDDPRRPLNFGLATARRRAMDRWHGVYSWMRLRPRDTLQREREREKMTYV